MTVTDPAAKPAAKPAGPASVAGVRPVAAVLASMSSVQLGAALSIASYGTFGVLGTTWLRVSIAALVLLAIARPWRQPRAGLLAAAGLGVVMAGMMSAFSLATDRVPLGVVVAIEFCGPLAVAAIGARGGRRPIWLVWPLLAAAGVLVLTHPWSEDLSGAGRAWLGLGFAALAAAGWGAYILLTAHVGRQTTGLTGLSVALAVTAAALLPAGIGQAAPALRSAFSGSAHDLGGLGRMALAAALSPLIAYALELGALRSVDARVFGVWMALEPAIAALVGLVFLAQGLTWLQVVGLTLVVLAGAGAHRGSAG